MFVDLSFFEVAEGEEERFEQAFAAVVAQAREAEGCVTSDFVRLTEERVYCWVERWVNRDAHLRFNEFLFGELLPGIPWMNDVVTRLTSRDAEGVAID